MSGAHRMKMMVFGLLMALAPTASHALLVNYNSTNGSGLHATANFTLVDSTHLSIVLTNTSASNNTQNGSANMVLSSLNFDLGGVDIIGGSAFINAGSQYVRSTNTSAWSVIASPANLNGIWGYTNDDLGQPSTPPGGGTGDNAVSQRGTGGGITLFNGGTQNGGSLDNGLVPTGTNDIGNNRNFIMNAILINLTLSAAITDLSFLENGSFVEFGSDYLFVPGVPEEDEPQEPVIPEPATLVLLGIGLAGMNAVRRFRKG